ncbi:DUF6177 family protein [Kribbella sp. NPDC051586]|uniref:DUF6177 family protein n=1 Tax=Kribbella sp. NPDC051586 TaxID=3364118 RepID=UPI0037B1D962
MPNDLMFSPGVDLITDRVAVVMQDRAVVGMSSWLADAVLAATAEDRGIQLVTSPATRLTWPVRSKLFGEPISRWVVAVDDDEYFDGLNGARLKWNGELFVAVLTGDGDGTADIHPAFLVEETPTAHLQLTVRVRHQATESLEVGHLAEKLFTETTGGGPTGWSTSEPVTQPWSPAALTEYCRGRAPAPTWLVLSGQPGDDFKPARGTLELLRTMSGVDETVTLCVAQPGTGFPPVTDVGRVIDDVADNFELISALVMGSYGAADGTYQPRFAGVAGPIGVAAGYEALNGRPLAEALAVDGIPTALAIGPAHKPALWYPLGDGRPEDWGKFQKVMEKLVPAA